jgi:hypothetical protein
MAGMRARKVVEIPAPLSLRPWTDATVQDASNTDFSILVNAIKSFVMQADLLIK